MREEKETIIMVKPKVRRFSRDATTTTTNNNNIRNVFVIDDDASSLPPKLGRKNRSNSLISLVLSFFELTFHYFLLLLNE